MQVTWSLDRRTASWWHCSWLLWWVSGFSAPFPPSAQDWALTQGWSTLPYEARVLGSTGYTECTEPDTTWTQKYYIRIPRLQILQQYNVNYLLKIDSARMFFFCTSFDSSRHITSSAVCFNTLQDIPRPNQYKHYTSNLYPTMLNKKIIIPCMTQTLDCICGMIYSFHFSASSDPLLYYSYKHDSNSACSLWSCGDVRGYDVFLKRSFINKTK